MISYLLIVIGFVLLTFSADALVNGASSLAKRMHVSDLVIGLTVVAFGTSAPELVVNLVAAVEGSSQIALTNILGSNSINTLIILGLSALVCPIVAQRSLIRVEIPMSLFAGIAVLLMGLNGMISRLDGLLLLLVFLFFMYHSVRMGKVEEVPIEGAAKPKKLIWAILLVVGGLAGLVLGGQLIVKSAVKIATAWGVSEAIVGVTIVALGTSLPELATSIVAAHKGNSDIAIGNVIGSNIFNVFFVLGTSALIRPLSSYANLWADASVAALGSLLVLLFVCGKKHTISRWHGALMLLVYAAYLTWMITTI